MFRSVVIQVFNISANIYIIYFLRFWARATREGVPIVDYWENRIRKSLKTRYDYREGVFDWDYYMILKSRGITNLTIQEYRYVC